jgi:hypothetical protein
MKGIVAATRRPFLAICLCALAVLFAVVPSALARGVAAENLLPGDSHWTAYKHLAPAAVIEGYSSESSVAPGEQLQLHVNSPASSYRIEISRLGWYGGAGGRLIACVPNCSSSEGPVTQTNSPIVNSTTGELDADWTVTDTVEIGRKGRLVSVHRDPAARGRIRDLGTGADEHLAGLQPLAGCRDRQEPL